MEPFLAVIVFAFSIGVFLVLWRKDSRDSIIFTPFLILMANEFLRVMPAFVYTAISKDVTDGFPLIVYTVSFIGVSLGFLLSMEYMKYKSSMPLEFQSSPTKVETEKGLAFAIVCGSVFLVLAGLYLYQGLPSVTQAIIGLLTGEEIGEMQLYVGESRKLLTKGHYFGGEYRGQGLVSSLLHVGWPFLCCLALVSYFHTKKSAWFLMFSLLLILSFVFVAGEGTRGPFLNALILIIVLFSYIRNIRYRNVYVIGLVLPVVAILVGIYSPKSGGLLRGEDTLWNVFAKIWERILVGNSLNDVWAIELIRSSVLKYRLGEVHLRDLIAAFPGTGGGLPFAHELYLHLHPGAKGTVYASGTYITKAFIDFGIVGVGFLFFGIGCFAAFCEYFILRAKRTPLNLTMAAFLAFFTGQLVLNGPIGVASAMVVVVGFYIFIRLAIVLSVVFRVAGIRE